MFRIAYSEEKNLLLRATRGVGFKEIVAAIDNGKILADLAHHQEKRRKKQRILAVDIDGYAYAVPYVINQKNRTIFFKTVYPSRVLTKKYLKRRKI